MSCRNAYPATTDRRDGHPVRDMVCGRSAEDRTRLYLIAFLLRANEPKAERYLVTGFERDAEDDAPFRDWMYSWARNIVFRNAVRLMALRPEMHRKQRALEGPSMDCHWLHKFPGKKLGEWFPDFSYSPEHGLKEDFQCDSKHLFASKSAAIRPS